jgi:hypothetical protein
MIATATHVTPAMHIQESPLPVHRHEGFLTRLKSCSTLPKIGQRRRRRRLTSSKWRFIITIHGVQTVNVQSEASFRLLSRNALTRSRPQPSIAPMSSQDSEVRTAVSSSICKQLESGWYVHLNDGPELLDAEGELNPEELAGECGWDVSRCAERVRPAEKSVAVEHRGESSRCITWILPSPNSSRSQLARRSAAKTDRCWPPVHPKANSARWQPRLRKSWTSAAIRLLSTSKNWSKQLRVRRKSSTAPCVPSSAGISSMSGRGSGRKRISITRFASGAPVLKAKDETTTSGWQCASAMLARIWICKDLTIDKGSAAIPVGPVDGSVDARSRKSMPGPRGSAGSRTRAQDRELARMPSSVLSFSSGAGLGASQARHCEEKTRSRRGHTAQGEGAPGCLTGGGYCDAITPM